MFYRRKPIEVKAVRFMVNEQDVPPFFKAFNISFPILRQFKDKPYIIVPTKYGAQTVNLGSWLILEDDILTVMHDDNFKNLYEKINRTL